MTCPHCKGKRVDMMLDWCVYCDATGYVCDWCEQPDGDCDCADLENMDQD